jgi:hypothetical protein
MRLAIIVPYRDRRDELDVFLPHMEEFLENKNIDYKIFVADQSDDRPFNYGKLCNAVVNEIVDEYDYFCFHDIDLLPINDSADYTYKEYPIQLAYENENQESILPYPEYFGGVVTFPRELFLKINGYGNDYWGNGYVDLDLLYRCIKNDIALEKKHNYNNNQTIYSDLKTRLIHKPVSILKFPLNAHLRVSDSNVLSKNYTVSFYLQTIQNTQIFRTYNGFDVQIFTNNDAMYFQFFDSNKVMFQIDINDIELSKLNHYSFVHDFNNSVVKFYYNGELKIEEKYHINYDYSNKNVILGGGEELKVLDFKLFARVLNDVEVKRNYYYGIESDCLDFNSYCFYKDTLSIILDKQFNLWEFHGLCELDNAVKNFNKPAFAPKKVKGEYKIIGNKFTEIENTYYGDIVENKNVYFNDLLKGKINTNKFGLKTVKYTLLNRITFNEHTEWLKIST